MTRRTLKWLFSHPILSAYVFLGISGVAAGAVISITGNSPIACSPTTGAVVCSSSVLIDQQIGNYTIPNADAGYLVNINCSADCTVTLPASGGTAFAANTALSVANISNAAEKPILLVGTKLFLNATTGSYTAVGAGNLIRVGISYGSSGSVTSVTDSPNGDTCTAVSGTATTSGANGIVMFSCPNIAASGAQTFTVTITGSPTYNHFWVEEFSGAAIGSCPSSTCPDDQGAHTSGTLTSPTLATAGNMALRGEWIDAAFNNTSGTVPTPGQSKYSYDTGGFGNSFIAANGNQQYTFNWGSNGSTYLAMVAGIKPAHPISLVNLCPGLGTSIVGPTSSGCSPLPAGYRADIVVNGSGNYQVQVVPPIEIPMDDATASFNMSLVNCRQSMDILGYNSSNPIIVTVPTGLPDCTMNIEQGGTAKAQIAVGANMNSLESLGGNVYTGGQFSQANITTRGQGNAANFGGTTSATNP